MQRRQCLKQKISGQPVFKPAGWPFLFGDKDGYGEGQWTADEIKGKMPLSHNVMCERSLATLSRVGFRSPLNVAEGLHLVAKGRYFFEEFGDVHPFLRPSSRNAINRSQSSRNESAWTPFIKPPVMG